MFYTGGDIVLHQALLLFFSTGKYYAHGLRDSSDDQQVVLHIIILRAHIIHIYIVSTHIKRHKNMLYNI